MRVRATQLEAGTEATFEEKLAALQMCTLSTWLP
jgi:hypothetical protein